MERAGAAAADMATLPMDKRWGLVVDGLFGIGLARPVGKMGTVPIYVPFMCEPIYLTRDILFVLTMLPPFTTWHPDEIFGVIKN